MEYVWYESKLVNKENNRIFFVKFCLKDIIAYLFTEIRTQKGAKLIIFTELTLYIFLNKSVHNPEDAHKSETLNYYILLIVKIVLLLTLMTINETIW